MPTRNLDNILKLEVPIVVRLGERGLTIAEVVALIPGSIIQLEKQAEDELDLMVNNKQIATGSAVKVGENFGLRITFIGDLRDRIAAMAGGPATAEAGADHPAAATPAGQTP